MLILVEYVELLMAQSFTLAGSAGGHICRHGGKGVGTLGQTHGAVKGSTGIKVHVVNHAGVCIGVAGDLNAGGDGIADYLTKLAAASEQAICSFTDLLSALEKRLHYFKETTGTTVSDDGIPFFAWADWTEDEVEAIFQKAREGKPTTQAEQDKYRSAFLFNMARIYKRNGFLCLFDNISCVLGQISK